MYESNVGLRFDIKSLITLKASFYGATSCNATHDIVTGEPFSVC